MFLPVFLLQVVGLMARPDIPDEILAGAFTEKVEEEQFDVSVELIIVSTETVVQTRAGFVESKSQVVAVNNHFGLTQLFSLEKVSSVRKKA